MNTPKQLDHCKEQLSAKLHAHSCCHAKNETKLRCLKPHRPCMVDFAIDTHERVKAAFVLLTFQFQVCSTLGKQLSLFCAKINSFAFSPTSKRSLQVCVVHIPNLPAARKGQSHWCDAERTSAKNPRNRGCGLPNADRVMSNRERSSDIPALPGWAEGWGGGGVGGLRGWGWCVGIMRLPCRSFWVNTISMIICQLAKLCPVRSRCGRYTSPHLVHILHHHTLWYNHS